MSMPAPRGYTLWEQVQMVVPDPGSVRSVRCEADRDSGRGQIQIAGPDSGGGADSKWFLADLYGETDPEVEGRTNLCDVTGTTGVFTRMTQRPNFDARPGTDWTVFLVLSIGCHVKLDAGASKKGENPSWTGPFSYCFPQRNRTSGESAGAIREAHC